MKRQVVEDIFKIPFQEIADSPTVKSYVRWSDFERYLKIPPSYADKGSFDEYLLKAYRGKVDVLLGVKDNNCKVPCKELFDMRGYANFDAKEGRLLAYHLSSWNRGLDLHLEDGELTVLLEKPEDGYTGYHLAVNVKDDSSLTLLALSPENAKGLWTTSLEIFLERHARLALNIVVFDSLASPGAFYIRSMGAESSQMRVYVVAGRGKMLYLRQDSVLLEKDSSLVSGAVLASPDRSRIVLETNAINNASNTSSRVLAQGFVRGGMLVHKGVLRITPNGPGSTAVFDSNIVPLSENSLAYGVPMLEIETGDIEEARHASSTSPLDYKVLFYIMSRGFSRKEAEEMIIRGHYHHVAIEMNAPDSLSGYIEELVSNVISRRPI